MQFFTTQKVTWIQEALANESDFMEYLAGFNNRQILGNALSAIDCAIARYLKFKTGLNRDQIDFRLSDSEIIITGQDVSSPIPIWAKKISKGTLDLAIKTGKRKITGKMLRNVILASKNEGNG